LDRASISKAAETVRRGGLIVYPTDTVYGLGCDPFNPAAVASLFRAKGRSARAVPVLCSSVGKTEELVSLSVRAKRLARLHWPGALTIVAPLKRSVPGMLTQGSPDLGVRVPDHALCVKLIGACGGWLTGTSANLSGRPSAKSVEEAYGQLRDSVYMYLDGGRLYGTESTVVRVVGEKVTILRVGPVGVET
jgi:L-threonylcarbamoyladenylate synthase